MKYEVGDRVMVARRGPDHWDSGNCEWIPEMDDAIGKTYTISKVCNNGVNFEERNCKWPFACLELVDRSSAAREGDLVVITDHGGIYTTYQEMADLMGLTNHREKSYPTKSKNQLFKVLQVRPHNKTPEEIVAGIEDTQTGAQFLFDIKGLKVIAVQPTTNKETQIMEKVFETKSYIRGTETSKLTTDEIITAIRRTEEEIASLEQIKTKSKAITARIACLKDQLDKVVEVLDWRD